MTNEQVKALIIAILSIDPNRRDAQVSELALEADEILQHAREPFFPDPNAER